MSWGTFLYTDVYFNRMTFKTRYELEEAINEAEEELQWAKDNLRKLAYLTEPKKFCEEEETAEFYIDNKLKDSIGSIEKQSVMLYKLQLLHDVWDEVHDEDGNPIEPDKETKSYIVEG